jgi:enolase
MKIKEVKAIEIIDSRGNPTIRCFLFLDDGSLGITSIPSGASTGSHEAFELKDGGKRYHGQGVKKAVDNINLYLKKIIINQIADPQKIDERLIKEDGTANKSHFGANAILAVSQALVKALACYYKKPLWQFLSNYYFGSSFGFPYLMVNLINGGAHANFNFDLQEFLLSPKTNQPEKAIEIASEIFHQMAINLKKEGLSTLVGDEGGFSPNLKNNEEALELIIKSAADLGYQNGVDFNLALDCAASQFYHDGVYFLKKEEKKLSAQQLKSYYLYLKEKYQIFSFEDPFFENDWENFRQFTTQVSPSLVVGDDLYTTNLSLIKKGIAEKTTNAVLIKPNQIGTVTETALVINEAKKEGWQIIVSHRSGETEDAFIADLSYAAKANFLKSGSICRGERVVKYNRLIEIANGF